MARSVDIPGTVLALSDDLWRSTRRLRAQLNHGTGSCPERFDPFSLRSVSDRLCDRCSEFHAELLAVASVRLNRLGSIDLTAFAGHAARHWKSWALDARDRVDSAAGLHVRLERLPRRKWFASAVPDELDQRLVIDVLFFVRSGDTTGRYDLPIERLARRFGVSEEDAGERICEALGQLRRARPAWVEANFDRPFAARVMPAPDLADVDLADERNAVLWAA